MKYVTRILAALVLVGVAYGQTPAPPSGVSRAGGRFVASQYAYGVVPNAPSFKVAGGSAATGAQTITLNHGAMALQDGRVIYPFATNAPITIDVGSNAETVTPSAVSGCTSTTDFALTCSITATFANIHPAGVPITSGTDGLQEAINDSFLSGGGLVVADTYWASLGGTTAILTAAVPYVGVVIEDTRQGVPQYWNVGQATASFLAVPTTLTAVTALPSATPVGAYGTGTYHLCISYVDVAGNEGACSLDFSEAGLATGSFIFSAPAASTGAVGYTIYISLTSGTYALAYQVPLTSTVCALTKIETITPACAVANTTYGQSGATATVTAITTNTAPLALQLGAASTTSDYVGNSNGRTIYGYTPSSRQALAGVVGSSYSFTAGPATVATTVPQVLGTIAIPPGFMNVIGHTIRVCGKTTETTTASATIQNLQLWWDGAGSNTAGAPVNIGNMQDVVGTAVAAVNNGSFCETFVTTVSGAGATAGSILGGNSFYGLYPVSAQTQAGGFSGNDILAAAVASLNLAGGGGFTTRLHVVQLHTGGTDVSPKLLNVTVEVL